MTRPGMQDGRIFTNYLPNCQLNNSIQSSQKVLNNVDYKSYIQQNAGQIMNDFTSSTNSDISLQKCLPSSTVQMS